MPTLPETSLLNILLIKSAVLFKHLIQNYSWCKTTIFYCLTLLFFISSKSSNNYLYLYLEHIVWGMSFFNLEYISSSMYLSLFNYRTFLGNQATLLYIILFYFSFLFILPHILHFSFLLFSQTHNNTSPLSKSTPPPFPFRYPQDIT